MSEVYVVICSGFSPGARVLRAAVRKAALEEKNIRMVTVVPALSGLPAAEADLRALLAIPDHYKVLFLQGGASSQFAMVPMNLLRGGQDAAYLKTGSWSKKAISEARRYCAVNVAATTDGV